MDELLPAFSILLPSVPLVIVHVIGIIISAAKLGRYRKAAALAMAGFGGLLLSQLVRAANTIMTLPPYRGSMSARELGARFMITSIITMMLTLGGMILLLLAIFADRDKKH